ncbi:NAD(P)(+) transhydrogenase (Re/Si-specific) subunit beta [Nitrococcus mobilis]|uniref:NAD(P) transhydrogenase subunit beta n=1 Tax=Nitrococcus mobilis Nb-231 TaxID=314278 RepID=A4BMW4_9GAMM|nr:NAD(P)(+) transhydrogenase (Re/Si-specific) subunit beta [Nitrococcus mobilis]EAR22563.1 pyridine nucleotide transhydrogenase subunit beta [Nitrococcus mobilis Nb-231]
MNTVVQLCYFVAAVLFILGLKGMSSPRTARKGIVWAGIGMVLATVATFFHPDLHHAVNYLLIILAIAVSGGLAWWSGKRVPMTDMPQMVALYNGMGGGAAAAIGAVELFKAVSQIGATSAQQLAAQKDLGLEQVEQFAAGHSHVGSLLGADHAVLGISGALIGAVAFSGSLVAWAKLDGRLHRNQLLPAQQLVNLGVFVATVLFAILSYYTDGSAVIIVFFVLALVFGVFMAIPIGGADMPVVISLFNALTGLAVGFEGYLLGNPAMIIAGTVVGAAGSLLTQLMAKAMNRPLTNVLFSGFGTATADAGSDPEGEMKAIQAEDAAIMMGYANQVVIAPGYGMAVAQAQHKVWELVELLQERDVSVKFAIHPVAGRMPGHMNVLLAEAGVPYDLIYDMEEINAEFDRTDVVVVIGANDVVNPAAKNDPSSPIYGMPILDVAAAHNVIVIKRGKGKGFSGVENHLFFADNCRMLFNDGQKAAGELIQVLKKL